MYTSVYVCVYICVGWVSFSIPVTKYVFQILNTEKVYIWSYDEIHISISEVEAEKVVNSLRSKISLKWV